MLANFVSKDNNCLRARTLFLGSCNKQEEKVSRNPHLVTVILALWTASLAQFTLVVTATKSKKTRPVLTRSASSMSDRHSCAGSECCPTEASNGASYWPSKLLVSLKNLEISYYLDSVVVFTTSQFIVLLQDAPFLVLRLLLIFRYDVLSYTNIFFTSKNSLVLILQIYRLVVLFTESRQPPPHSTHSTELLSSHSTPTSLSRSSSVLNLHGTAVDYDSTLSRDQSSFSDGDHARKRRMAFKNSARERNGHQAKCSRSSIRRHSQGHTNLARSCKDLDMKSKKSNFKSHAKNGTVAMTMRSEVIPTTSKPHNRKLPNAFPGKKSKQAERGNGPTQEVEVKSPGSRRAKKSGHSGDTSSQSGTPRSCRKLSARRDTQQTKDDVNLAGGSKRCGASAVSTGGKFKRQGKKTTSTTPPTDLSEEDRMAQTSCQRSGSKGHHTHHKSLGISPREVARLGRHSKENFSFETRDEVEEENEEQEEGEEDEAVDEDTIDLSDLTTANYDIEEEVANKEENVLESSAAGRRDEASRKWRKSHWCSAKDLKTALTFLNEADGYKTVVLKSGKGGKEMMVLNDTG
ncbi:transmembrane protein 26 [Elysia marginata]|uniref:Transmembrane protein 26 n=1 Tax=Elysia marginata TaxID=1093978 RepID=A0AAV4IB84_9GAST|nr:transmembrane protein 26 [Elysia marginata]